MDNFYDFMKRMHKVLPRVPRGYSIGPGLSQEDFARLLSLAAMQPVTGAGDVTYGQVFDASYRLQRRSRSSLADILCKFGVSKLRGLKATQFADFLAEVKAAELTKILTTLPLIPGPTPEARKLEWACRQIETLHKDVSVLTRRLAGEIGPFR